MPSFETKPLRAGPSLLIACVALLFAVAALWHAPDTARAAGDLRVSTVDEHPELIDTLPIGRAAGNRRQVVMSIPPDRLGALQDGDRLEATAEFETTVCLKPDPDHPGSGYPCIGETYGYDPHIEGRLVLAPSAGTTAPDRTTAVSDRHVLTCRQSMPNRNHHCVMAIGDGALDVVDAGQLSCPPSGCYLNLVASAWHSDSDAGEKVVIGSHTRDGVIQQNRGRLDAMRYRPGAMAKPAPRVSRVRQTRRLPIADEGREPIRRVVYSIPLRNLTQGEALVVDGKAISSLAGVPYNAFVPAEIILAERPGATDDSRLTCQVTGCDAEIARTNGVNCTQGPSAHPDPCLRRKFGTVEIERSTSKTLYLNMVVGMMALPNRAGQTYHSGDHANVRRGGFLRVFRHGLDLEPCDGQRPTIAGSGEITGGPGSDVILGSAGADVISAGQGNDLVCGGGGNDVVYGQADDDRILGGSGNDELSGGLDADRLLGGDGDDTLSGEAGPDVLFGGLGDDDLFGGIGNDQLDGGSDTDRCEGQADTDRAQACESVASVP